MILKISNKFITKLIILSTIFLVVFFWSSYIFGLYYAGDQIAYTRFYTESAGMNFFETWVFQQGMIGAAEPAFAFMIYIFNDFVNKSAFMSFSNGIMATLLFDALKNRKETWILFFFFIFNYYVSVLFFSAERLKFAFILALFILKMKNGTIKNILLITPALFHFQYLLMLPIIYIGMYRSELNTSLKNLKFRFSISQTIITSLIIAIVSIILISFNSALNDKYLAYFEAPNNYDLLRAALITGFMIAVLKEKIVSSIVAMYFVLIIFFLGTERIIILEVAYIFATIKLTSEYIYAGFLLIGTYFLYKTIQFYSYVFECGHGFLC